MTYKLYQLFEQFRFDKVMLLLNFLLSLEIIFHSIHHGFKLMTLDF